MTDEISEFLTKIRSCGSEERERHIRNKFRNLLERTWFGGVEELQNAAGSIPSDIALEWMRKYVREGHTHYSETLRDITNLEVTYRNEDLYAGFLEARKKINEESIYPEFKKLGLRIAIPKGNYLIISPVVRNFLARADPGRVYLGEFELLEKEKMEEYFNGSGIRKYIKRAVFNHISDGTQQYVCKEDYVETKDERHWIECRRIDQETENNGPSSKAIVSLEFLLNQ